MKKTRSDFLNIFAAAIDSVSGKLAVKKEFESEKYPDYFHVIAIGKASDAMLQGVISTETATNKKIKSSKSIF